MRYLVGVIICAISLAAVPVRASYGRVVYALTQDRQPGGPADIFERGLDAGETKLLIPQASFPKDFNTPIIALSVSPDGRYLALGQEQEIIFGEPSGDTPPEVDITVIPHGLWIWERETGRFRLALKEYAAEELHWSPAGDHLAVFDMIENRLLMYELATGRLRRLGPYYNLQTVAWSVEGDGLIVVDGSTVYFQPVTRAKRQVLFKWAGQIWSLARSPIGYAVYDGGIRLADPKGHHIRETHIPVRTDDPFFASLAVSGDGSRLAVLTSYIFGEPHINTDEALWAVDMKSGKASRISAWQESYHNINIVDSLSQGNFVSRELIGWLPDGKSVLISGQVTWGGEGVADNREDRYRLWVYDVTGPKGKGKGLFDSGPGCLGLAWWPGER